jgi:hypothetical protein
MVENINKGGHEIGSRRRWTISVFLGAAIVAVACLLFRAPAPPPPPNFEARQTIGLRPPHSENSDPVSAEEAEFYDPTPLFMPTHWNSSQKALPRREAYGSFSDFGPRFAFDAGTLTLALAPAISVPSGAPEALEKYAPGNPALGIGRVDVATTALPPRQARIDIVAERSGQRVGRYDLPPGSIPALENREWHFLDLMAVTDAAGLVGPLMPAPRLIDEGGNYFPPLEGDALLGLENYLTHHVLLGLRLTPGFYRISVGP